MANRTPFPKSLARDGGSDRPHVYNDGSDVPVAPVVAPGARAWFECPMCGCHARSGDYYVAHVCQPYKGK